MPLIDAAALPGWTFLFEEREHLLQTIHLSLREFLLDANRSGSHVADIRRGHIILSQSCLQILLEHNTGPTLAYALRHGLHHLTAVLQPDVRSHSSVDSIDIAQQWFSSFLQPRLLGLDAKFEPRAAQHQSLNLCQLRSEPEPEQEDASVDHERGATAELELEPEPEPAQEPDKEQRRYPSGTERRSLFSKFCSSCCATSSKQRDNVRHTKRLKGEKLSQPYTLSQWQARGAVADWLERQAAHGRSKLLVTELLSLEEALVRWSQDDPKAWIRALQQLVQELRWGIGTFWAAHYDTSPVRARAMFVANACGNGTLYRSDAMAKLGPQSMYLPARIAISPTIHQLVGHRSTVSSASFSPDGTKVVSGSHDKTVRIWDAVTGECEQTLQGHSSTVTSASFSPDGTKVVSGSWDKTVRIWDAVTGECEQTLQGHSDGVNSASFSPDGTKVVSCSGAVSSFGGNNGDNTVRIWDEVTGECEQTLQGHSESVNSASFSPDGTKVVSGSGDKTVRIWDAVTGEYELVWGAGLVGLVGFTAWCTRQFRGAGSTGGEERQQAATRLHPSATASVLSTWLSGSSRGAPELPAARATAMAVILEEAGFSTPSELHHLEEEDVRELMETLRSAGVVLGDRTKLKRCLDKTRASQSRVLVGEANGSTLASTTAGGDGLARSSTVVEGNTCPICLNVMVDACTLSCGHSGCLGCLESVALRGSTRCPTCRAEHHGDLHVSVALTYNIERLYRSDQEARADEVTAARLEHAETLLRFQQTSNALALLRRAKRTASQAHRAEIDAKIAAVADQNGNM